MTTLRKIWISFLVFHVHRKERKEKNFQLASLKILASICRCLYLSVRLQRLCVPVYAHGDEKRACSILGTGAIFKVGACPRCSYASNTENALAKQETLAEVTVSPIDTMQICSIVLNVCI